MLCYLSSVNVYSRQPGVGQYYPFIHRESIATESLSFVLSFFFSSSGMVFSLGVYMYVKRFYCTIKNANEKTELYKARDFNFRTKQGKVEDKVAKKFHYLRIQECRKSTTKLRVNSNLLLKGK